MALIAYDHANRNDNKIALTFDDGPNPFWTEKIMDLLEEHGVKFIDVDREAFEKLAKEKLPPEFKDSWEPGVFERIVNVK